MPWFTVRRTKVLRIAETASIGVEAADAEAAIQAAIEQDDDPLWIEDERETLATHIDVFREGCA
jgi:post-segregation antitoxin (ccd killing protein)